MELLITFVENLEASFFPAARASRSDWFIICGNVGTTTTAAEPWQEVEYLGSFYTTRWSEFMASVWSMIWIKLNQSNLREM